MKNSIDYYVKLLGRRGLVAVDLGVKNVDVLFKLRRYIGPRHFDVDLKDEKDWFLVELIIYSDSVQYQLKGINFDGRDRIRMISLNMGFNTSKETATLEEIEEFVISIMDEMDELTLHPSPYIDAKLKELI